MSLLTDLHAYAQAVFPRFSAEQHDDLEHLAIHHDSSLCAARGFGKTLIACIYETFMAERHWNCVHIFKNQNQAKQWFAWMELLGWETTQWSARRGDVHVDLRLYLQGRGPRYDIIVNDEVGTVILPLELKQFSAAQNMLSGSALGKSIWIGTQDPNSIWSKAPHIKVRGYDPQQMPWVTRAYQRALVRDPPWMVDQDFHCLATPAGGLVLKKVHVQDFDREHFKTQRFGIDSNPEAGYFVVGSHLHSMNVYLTEAYCIPTLEGLADFIWDHPLTPFELEMNGVGGVVAQYLRSQHCAFQETWTDDQIKIDRCKALAIRDVWVPEEYRDDVYPILMKQIWGPDKKIMKFPDAHYFDAFWLSVGDNLTGYIAGDVIPMKAMSIKKQERIRQNQSQ